MVKSNPLALLPIVVFLVVYLGLGITFEYILGVEMGFYSIPIVVALLIAIFVGCLQNRKLNLDEKLQVMADGLTDRNILTMVLIYLVAGTFVGVVGRSSAESVVYFTLSFIPARYAVVALFVVACFVSLTMGTSVGTVTLVVPIAVAVSDASGFGLPICVAAVVGGAMFGDNLSFISDTTIAACNGQGCEMKDKFKQNFKIAVPAALVTLVIILIISLNTDINKSVDKSYNLIQLIPYVLVLICGIIGLNVFGVLLLGVVSGAIIMLATGESSFTELITNMGTGCSGMFESSIIAILVANMSALIREAGGFEALLNGTKRVFKGNRGGQLGMGVLVSIIDVATANNTVAIIMSNPIAKEMQKEYNINPRRAASLLDTFSCVFQGIIPYGAQMLVAISTCNSLKHSITAFQVIPLLFYPYLLFVSSLFFIFFNFEKYFKRSNKEKDKESKTGENDHVTIETDITES
ncbi:Na+/H+ antiporter family-domain-containing protein [Neocallimastix sp. 'constans']